MESVKLTPLSAIQKIEECSYCTEVYDKLNGKYNGRCPICKGTSTKQMNSLKKTIATIHDYENEEFRPMLRTMHDLDLIFS